jgi:SAM-dependent methyltransferase
MAGKRSDAATVDSRNYDVIAELEASNWWYEARRDLLRRELSAHGPYRSAVDVGCGIGANLPVLQELAAAVVGVDPNPDAVRWSAGRRGGSKIVLGSAAALDLADASADLVVCLDVLEHIEDDRAALREIRRILVPGGLLMVTVPAHPHLWNDNDQFSHHVRRYRKRDLAARLSDWKVLEIGYWNGFAYPPMLAYSSFRRLFPARRPTNNLRHIPGLFNGALRFLAVAENRLRHRIAPWTGTSLLAIARRTDSPDERSLPPLAAAGGEAS